MPLTHDRRTAKTHLRPLSSQCRIRGGVLLSRMGLCGMKNERFNYNSNQRKINLILAGLRSVGIVLLIILLQCYSITQATATKITSAQPSTNFASTYACTRGCPTGAQSHLSNSISLNCQALAPVAAYYVDSDADRIRSSRYINRQILAKLV